MSCLDTTASTLRLRCCALIILQCVKIKNIKIENVRVKQHSQSKWYFYASMLTYLFLIFKHV